MTERHYPDKLEIVPLTKPPNATVRVPGSKSITNRALVLGALMDDGLGYALFNALDCADTRIMCTALRKLGYYVDPGWRKGSVQVWGPASIPGQRRPFAAGSAELFADDSGTSMRFLTALASAGDGEFRIDGSSRMCERPIEGLLSALRQLGVEAESVRRNGCPPVRIRTKGLSGGTVHISGEVSSQFTSGLLLAAIEAKSELTIVVDGPMVSMPYLDMTFAMMHQFGVDVRRPEPHVFEVPIPPRHYACMDLEYTVEPDATGASYFLSVAAASSGVVTVPDLPKESLQGDARFAGVLREMGCRINRGDLGVTVLGGSLGGIDADMNAISDCVPTLATVACFAEGPTTIRNVAHIRHKESDRISAMATELRKVGAEVDEFPDGLRITPRPLHGAEIDTYNDHRIAMSMALIGLKVPGIVIKNPGCVAKTYPGYWDDLEKLRN
jgi:3-phosphoshikimate 1-carboxyvinyltransferase